MKRSRNRRNKTESRELILKAASELFRKDGFEASGIDSLMENAGLTAGAFYAHFDSKSQLLEEALDYALNRSFESLTAKLDGLSSKEKIYTVFSRYLSVGHRDQPEKGCALVGLAAELSRQDTKIRQIVAAYIERLANYIAEELTDIPEDERFDRAIQMITSAVGGLLLSRITKGSALSDTFLVS